MRTFSAYSTYQLAIGCIVYDQAPMCTRLTHRSVMLFAGSLVTSSFTSFLSLSAASRTGAGAFLNQTSPAATSYFRYDFPRKKGTVPIKQLQHRAHHTLETAKLHRRCQVERLVQRVARVLFCGMVSRQEGESRTWKVGACNIQ